MIIRSAAPLLLMLGVLLSSMPLAITATSAAALPAWLRDPRTRLVRVRAAAVIELPWETLAASGWDLTTIPLSQVQVWRQGRQRAIQVTAAGIAFVAEASESRYSMEAVYWIGIGPDVGLRTVRPATPSAPLVWEPDAIYQSIAPTLRGDRWFAGELRTAGAPLEMTLSLPEMLPAGSEIELALTAIDPHPAHALTIRTETGLVATLTWGDTTRLTPRQLVLTTTTALPVGPLRLQFSLTTGSPDLVLIDALTISAARVALPRLTPALELPRGKPTLGYADQLIIAHPYLIPALDPLVAFKQQRGEVVGVLDVLALYDAYSWGERDPEAIRQYLRELPVELRPSSVLLVGAGTARLRVVAGADDPWIPPYLLPIDPVYGEVGCDTCYTRLDADNVQGDLLPDIAIGRLPARSLAEAASMVAKTLSALQPLPGDWQSRALLLADNDRDADGTTDLAGPFAPLVDDLARTLGGMQTERLVYAPDQGLDTGPTFRTAPALRKRLLSAWDAGAGLITYVGHASPWQWAWTGPQEAVPHLLTRSDAQRANAARLPILVSLTCLSGSFANPTLTTIDEELVRAPDGGVAAALSPSGSGVNTGHRALGMEVLSAIDDGATLGAAHLAGLRSLISAGGASELAYSYAILGDPEVRLPAKSAALWQVALPEVVR